MRILALLFAFVASPFVAASASAYEGNVILITVDGVRAMEFFGGVQKPARAGMPRGQTLFPRLWSSIHDGSAFAYGASSWNGVFHVADSSAISMPGYRTILSGVSETACESNSCPNIDRETIFDRLASLHIPSGAVASWSGIGNTLESTPGRIDRNVAFEPFPEIPLDADARAAIDRAIEASKKDPPPWSGSRKDAYTWEIGKAYYFARQPRFFYLSFVDSDELGHANRYHDYAESLLSYDSWIAEIRARLAASGEWGDHTSIIVTTDHGRSIGPFWRSHGKLLPGSFHAWAAVVPAPALVREGALEASPGRHDQLDIRPTIEWLLGDVGPAAGAKGRPLVEPKTAAPTRSADPSSSWPSAR